MRLMPLVPLLALAACEAPRPAAPTRDVLTLRQVAAETSGRPYECTKYEAETDSCEAIARWSIHGNAVHAETLFALNTVPPAKVRVRSRHRIDAQGRSCGFIGTPQVTVQSAEPAETEKAIAGRVAAALAARMATACATFIRAGDGYMTEVRDAQGHLMEGGTARARFFERPRRLRPVQMQAP